MRWHLVSNQLTNLAMVVKKVAKWKVQTNPLIYGGTPWLKYIFNFNLPHRKTSLPSLQPSAKPMLLMSLCRPFSTTLLLMLVAWPARSSAKPSTPGATLRSSPSWRRSRRPPTASKSNSNRLINWCLLSIALFCLQGGEVEKNQKQTNCRLTYLLM